MDRATWKRVKEICADALERDATERDEVVARRCAGDAAVEAEVQRLLAANERAEPGFLEAPTGGPVPIARPFEVGRRVGAWELVDLLGAGGMGVVYLAERREGDFEQRAALKVMGLAAHERLEESFQRERQVLAGLEHPNIARLIDGGTTDEGLPYFAMEYVEGRPIDRFCEEERLTTDERLALFLEVCSAVGHAHGNLVVHRDLKPSNILVTPEGKPKLLDFGIAKLMAEGSGDSAATRLHALTPAYASPEQLEGRAITTASDVYSLGALLYRLLAGRTPHAGGDRPLPELARERTLTPARPSAVVDGAAARRLRGDLDDIVLKTLRPEPERRYGSVESLAEDIRRHREGLPVGARHGTFSYLFGKFVRRHKAAVAAAALVAVALVGATVASSRAARVAETERAKAERISGFLQGMISAPDASWFSSGKSGRDVTVIEVLKEAERSLDGEQDLQPAEEAMIRRTLGSTYRGLGLYDEAEDLLREAVRLSRVSFAPGSHDLGLSLVHLAATLQFKGEFDEAIELYREGIDIFRRQTREPGIELSGNINNLGLIFLQQGDLVEAESLLREALELSHAQFGDAHPISLIALSNLGNIRAARGDLEEAGALYERALRTFRELPDANWEIAYSLTGLAGVAIYLEQYDRAESYVQEAMAIATDALGEDHPQTAFVRAVRAHLAYRRGDLENAESEQRAVVQIQERSLGSEHLELAGSLTGLGRILTARGAAGEAEGHLLRALELRRSQLPAGDGRIGVTLGALGESLAAQGRLAEAESMLTEAVATLRATIGPEHLLSREAEEQLRAVRERENAASAPGSR